MKLNGINKTSAFKALVIHQYKKDDAQNFLKQYEETVNNAAKDSDIFISADDKIIQEGHDYIISIPVINVAIHPIEKVENNKMVLDKKYKTVMSTAFTYVPSVQNEKEGKFAEVLQKSLSLIG